MLILGIEHLQALMTGAIPEAKMVFNDCGAIVFPVSTQHRDMKADGISYEDNYAGNALAAILRNDAIEIRFHQRFDDNSVRRIIARLLASPAFSCLANARITYQGRPIVM